MSVCHSSFRIMKIYDTKKNINLDLFVLFFISLLFLELNHFKLKLLSFMKQKFTDLLNILQTFKFKITKRSSLRNSVQMNPRLKTAVCTHMKISRSKYGAVSTFVYKWAVVDMVLCFLYGITWTKSTYCILLVFITMHQTPLSNF